MHTVSLYMLKRLSVLISHSFSLGKFSCVFCVLHCIDYLSMATCK